MHVPDGFIAPQVYLPTSVVTIGLWSYALRRLQTRLRAQALPRLAVLTALAFVLMMIAIPLPGGTSVHAAGIGILAVMFGVWVPFICVSLVLLLQALMFGVGGITALAVNALAMGLVGSTAAWSGFHWLRGRHEGVALFVAGWLSVVVPAALLALVLGLQPTLARAADGSPLFFPFGLSITLPAILIPHALIGIGEGVLTVLVYRLVTRGRRSVSA